MKAFQTPWQTPRLLKTSGLLAALLAVALVAASCGGGGGGTTSTTPAVVATTDSFGNDIGGDALGGFGIDGGSGGSFGGGDSGADGTGGEGPPLVNAAVLITDSTGKTATAITNADGYYRAKITGMVAPLVVRLVAQNGKVYVSMRADPIKTGFNTINATSFTDKIASNLATANSKLAATELTPAMVTAALLTSEQAKLKSALSPALSAAGIGATHDFIATPFKADGTKIDQVLELVRHEISSDGSTKLYTKRPTVDTNNTANNLELSASAPLPAASGNELNFAKLKALQARLDNCASLQVATACTGIYHHLYNQNTMSFDEQLKQASGRKRYNTSLTAANLFQGAKFDVPEVLAKFESSAGSGVFDTAVVELRWFQSADSSYRSLITNARTFAGYVNPLDTTTPSSAGGDWWLYGNQRIFDASIYMRARQSINLNPGTNNTANINNQSFHMSGIGASINSYLFDTNSGQWVSANIRAVHVKGSGLPSAGLMYVPLNTATTCVGNASIVGANAADYHALHSTTMTTFPASATFSANSPHHWLKRTSPSGSLLSLPSGSASMASLAALNAWNIYTFTVQRQDLSTATFTARNVASALEPDTLSTLPLHSLNASDSLFTAPQAAAASVTLPWSNSSAMPGAVYAWALSRSGTTTYNSEKRITRNKTSLSSAFGVSFAASDVSQWPGCNASGNTTALHALDNTANTYREWNLRTNLNRVGIDQIRRWQN